MAFRTARITNLRIGYRGGEDWSQRDVCGILCMSRVHSRTVAQSLSHGMIPFASCWPVHPRQVSLSLNRGFSVMERKCEYCGTLVNAKPSAIAKGHGRFCSLQHFGAWKHDPARVAERFWSYVSKSPGCWEWQGARIGGYGKFKINYKQVAAHRFSYELEYGEIPDGLFVCHQCDNRACVRPDHLFLGTPADNVEDAIQKDRWARGERSGRAKLTTAQVQEIRALREEGVKLQEIADRFGISDSAVQFIVARKNWRHV